MFTCHFDRLFVFLVVIVLYSGLFKFLRRPDIVHAGSFDFSGDDSQAASRRESDAPINMKTASSPVFPNGAVGGREGQDSGSAGEEDLGRRRKSSATNAWQMQMKMLSSSGGGGGGSRGNATPTTTTNDLPPWEQLHLNRVEFADEALSNAVLRPATGGGRSREESKSSDGTVVTSGSSGAVMGKEFGSEEHGVIGLKKIGNAYGNGNGHVIQERPSLPSIQGSESIQSAPTFNTTLGESESTVQILQYDMQDRGMLSASTMADGGKKSFHQDDGLYSPMNDGMDKRDPFAVVTSAEGKKAFPTHTAGLNRRRGSRQDDLESGGEEDDDDDDDWDPKDGPKPKRQTLQEFFASQQATFADPDTPRGANAGVFNSGRRRSSVHQMSAANYFNRQASLLMLYFPLAYLFLFSASLVRLLYDMVTAQNNVPLTIISLWFTLSVSWQVC